MLPQLSNDPEIRLRDKLEQCEEVLAIVTAERDTQNEYIEALERHMAALAKNNRDLYIQVARCKCIETPPDPENHCPIHWVYDYFEFGGW